MVMVMVATLTRPTAAYPLGQEGRCAEDGVSGVEERKKGWTREWGRMRESACVWSGEGVCVRRGGGGLEGRGGEREGSGVCVWGEEEGGGREGEERKAKEGERKE